MKILLAATPSASHLNPILAIARMALDRGDEVIVATATYLKPTVEEAGARFFPLASSADLNLSDLSAIFPDVQALPPGPEQLRRLFEHTLIDPMPAQLSTLRAAIADERPDVVVAEAYFMGLAALFLDPARPPMPLVYCGYTIFGLDRPDGAPLGLGWPPAQDATERARYAMVAEKVEESLLGPLRAYADAKLIDMGLPRLPCSVLAAQQLLADVYLHPTVSAFEYDYGVLPAHVQFVGALPPAPPRAGHSPDWWAELDEAKHAGQLIVLVTQGTVANADLSELIEPTLKALADRDDLLVLVTTGGRPVTSIRMPIPKNARLAEFLDYASLLPKLSVLVTNGGYGTVQLALRSGVPIVAAGRTEDKAEIGARVSWSGVGIEIPEQRPSAGQLRDALGKVLSDTSYRTRAQAIAADMAALDTKAEILGVLDRLVAKKSQQR